MKKPVNKSYKKLITISTDIKENNKTKNPVNRMIIRQNKNSFLKKFKKNNSSKYNNSITNKTSSGVSVITCTHMYCYMNNIIKNFIRQQYPEKELIIILNSNKLRLNEWKHKVRNFKNIRVFQLNESITVGSCMNFAVEKSRYNYIANFDHDDYYGEFYLYDYIKIVEHNDAGLFGKKTQFVFFEKNGVLALRNPRNENKYVDFIDGPTVFFKKSIFEKVRYIDSDKADRQLSYDCNKVGIKIFSINKENFCYIRRASKDMHTWKIEDDDFLALPFAIIGEVKNYKQFVNKKR